MSSEVWWQALRWQIAGKTGWTLDYIDGLSLGDIWVYLSVEDGQARASMSEARKRTQARKRRR